MKVHKTPKGTELPLIQLQGKDYLPVAQRVRWFREEKSLWGLETAILEFVVMAVVKDEAGRIVSTAHKSIQKTGPFPLEKAETGAIGRVLALIGYGTAFCGDDLEEGEDISDAPIESKKHSQADYPRANPNWENEPCTEPQRKKLWAMAKNVGMDASEFKDWVVSEWNVTETSLLSKSQIQNGFKMLEDMERPLGGRYDNENQLNG